MSIIDVTILDNSELVKQATKKQIKTALEAIAQQAEGHAKRYLDGEDGHPRRVDTSNLINHVDHRVVEDVAYIGTNVEYAIYVHEGTYKMEPNRFLKDALVNHVKEYEEIAKMILKG